MEEIIEELLATAGPYMTEVSGEPQPNTLRYRWPHGLAWFPVNRGGRMPRLLKKRLVRMMTRTNWGALRMDP